MDTLLRNSRRKLSQGLLFWSEAGQGIPVVLLHGAWNDSSQWSSVVEKLAQNFHCFAPDLLGFGESDQPKIHHSVDLQVECVAELLQALRLERVYLVGHSLGGWIAASYALKYPEQVEGLVLLAPEGVEVEQQEKRWHNLRKLVEMPQLFIKILKFIKPLTKVLGWHEKFEQDLQQRQNLLQYPTACQLLFQRQTPEIKAELLQDKLHLIQVPALILQGGQDTLDAVFQSQTYKQLISQVDFKLVVHAGNDLPESCAGIVAEEIRDFIHGNS
ncbi:alpha/beta hydrolase [Fortiea sp. LEGE XX443]|uniref:alpha/beta fold hydrolase n=1 Tax=Fortiea sp. LEGE XX443 TaxID=1828611 RepID=UPI001881DEF9|nr:alpha/beta hydrolase [Fortiea sp. LEGE XX443]MBE9008433.1 alpha/beta hydrolase [Fortiea sp. LEGE XX443]